MEYGAKLAVGTEVGPTGAFEVLLNGTDLIHSKLTMGHKRCETEEELDAVIERVGLALGK